jgi:hypothetical protein
MKVCQSFQRSLFGLKSKDFERKRKDFEILFANMTSKSNVNSHSHQNTLTTNEFKDAEWSLLRSAFQNGLQPASFWGKGAGDWYTKHYSKVFKAFVNANPLFTRLGLFNGACLSAKLSACTCLVSCSASVQSTFISNAAQTSIKKLPLVGSRKRTARLAV